MRLRTFIQAAEAYTKLGWAVHDQLHDIAFKGEDFENQNDNALRAISKFLAEFSDEIEDAEELREEIEEYLHASNV